MSEDKKLWLGKVVATHEDVCVGQSKYYKLCLMISVLFHCSIVT